MRNYSIAVVIPAYNAELYICDALDSIILQSRRPEQIIIVDDGSTDHTLERIHNWQRQYNGELCLLQQNHRGVAAARNTGIRHTTADLIAFLDADDLFLSHHLEQLERAFKNHPDLVLAFGDTEHFDSQRVLATSLLDGRGIGDVKNEQEDGFRLIHRSAYISLVRGNYILPSSAMCARNAIERVGFFDESLRNAEDRELFLRLSRIGPFACYPHVITRKRSHAANLTHPRHLMQTLIFQFLVLQKMLDHAEKLELSVTERQKTQEAMTEHIQTMLYSASRHGLKAYVKTSMYLIRNNKISSVWNLKHFLRALWWLRHRSIPALMGGVYVFPFC